MIRAALLAFVLSLLAFVARAAEPTTKPADLMLVQQGTLPLILTAPHGGKMAVPGVTAIREGKNVSTRFVTAPDMSTDVLAQKIAAGVEKRLGAKPHLIVARFAR